MERIAYLLVNMETQRRLRRDADAACKPMLARNFFQIITVKVCWMKNKRERERQENQTTKKGNWKIKPSFTLLEFWKVGPSVDLTRNVCAQKETQELELIAKRITRRKRRSRMKGWMLFCCCKENMKNFSRLLWKEEIQKKATTKKKKTRCWKNYDMKMLAARKEKIKTTKKKWRPRNLERMLISLSITQLLTRWLASSW